MAAAGNRLSGPGGTPGPAQAPCFVGKLCLIHCLKGFAFLIGCQWQMHTVISVLKALICKGKRQTDSHPGGVWLALLGSLQGLSCLLNGPGLQTDYAFLYPLTTDPELAS